jgi:hypothetical protein
MDDAPGGIDPQDVLREIAQALPMDAPLPDALPAEPVLPEAPAPADGTAPLEDAPPPRAPSRTLPRPTWWTLHRHEVAGLVTALIALVWMSLGIASRTWAPSLIGVMFAGGALLIGTRAVWTAD